MLEDDLDFSGDWGAPVAGDPDPGDTTPDAPAEPDTPTIEEALESGFDKLTPGDADDAQWQREQRRLADDTLRAAGINPDERHAAGLSRREVVRRLHAADRLLRADLPGGLEAIIQGYGPGLDPVAKTEAGGRVLRSLGFASPNAISDQERQRLAQYDSHAQQQRQAEAAAIPQIRQEIADFAARHADFEKLKPAMIGLISSGAASDLPGAYALAARALGVPTAPETAAQAADAQRREKVAKAQAAGTPRSQGTNARLADQLDGKSIDELLHAGFDALGVD